MLDIDPSCNLKQYQGKIMMKIWENDENPNFGPNLGPQIFFVSLTLLVRHCFKLSSYEIFRKTNEPNFRKWLVWLKFMQSNFFFQNLASSVTRYHGHLSPCTISEKNNGLILRKFSDAWTDGLTDGHTDESDFSGCCTANF